MKLSKQSSASGRLQGQQQIKESQWDLGAEGWVLSNLRKSTRILDSSECSIYTLNQVVTVFEKYNRKGRVGLGYGAFPPVLSCFFLSKNYAAPSHFFKYVIILSTQYTEWSFCPTHRKLFCGSLKTGLLLSL